MKDSRCKGCNFQRDICLIKYNKKLIDKCSCKECLIKVMCRTACYDRARIFSSLYAGMKNSLVDSYYQDNPTKKTDFLVSLIKRHIKD